jgi:hypothetical protein
MTTMTRKSRNGMEIATASEVQFACSIANPAEVLAAIEAGHAAVAEAGNDPVALGFAVGQTWIALAELEDDTVADVVCDELWPLDAEPHTMAKAA